MAGRIALSKAVSPDACPLDSALASPDDFTPADALAENLHPPSEAPRRSSPPILTKYGFMICFMLSLRSSPNQVLDLRLGLGGLASGSSEPHTMIHGETFPSCISVDSATTGNGLVPTIPKNGARARVNPA